MALGIWLVALHGRPVEQWLAEYDPDADGGAGRITSTADPLRAKRYPDLAAALGEWRRVSTVQPTRLDGKPNRPLSAYTITPQEIPEVR
jgi:hypothetical protein